ncbi:MAG: CoA transferase [Chloroflexi bacterium]|nr:CoA transferase [Chloroflexota bacterium]
MGRLPLEGLRVADITQVFAGPAATLWFAVFGAEVIKIENPARPDPLRRATRGPDGKLSYNPDPRITAFPALNISKKSCTLNLKDPKAQEIAQAIIRTSDVVAENFATGVMDRFGLGYNDLRKIKPDIVMLSVSGFGRTGPHKDWVAYASIATAFGGLTSITGYEGGQPEPIGGGWGDLLAAKFGAFMLLAALEQRRRTGQGAYIDLSMSEVIAALIPDALLNFNMNGRNQGPRGNRDSLMAPHNAYQCKGNDSWAVISVTNDEEWAALCDIIGKPGWRQDPRFANPSARSANPSEIDAAVAQWTSQHTSQEVMDRLQRAGIPAGRSSSIDQLSEDLQLKARGHFVEVPDYRSGTITTLRLPGTTPENSVHAAAPAAGEHNSYVLKELLGMTDSEVRQLEEEDVVLKSQ